jgi:hypothetical protein
MRFASACTDWTGYVELTGQAADFQLIRGAARVGRLILTIGELSAVGPRCTLSEDLLGDCLLRGLSGTKKSGVSVLR